MPKISKFLILIFSQIIFLFFIFIVLPSVFIKERPGISQTLFNQTLSLDSKNTYYQEFISDQDNLRSVSILLKNPALKNKNKVIIELLDQDNKTLRSLETSGISIGDPSWINFEFPYINSKKGDKFSIKISIDNPKTDELFVYGDLKSKNINFKTTYICENLQESIQKTITYQTDQFRQRDVIKNIIYITSIIFLNILVFLSL